MKSEYQIIETYSGDCYGRGKTQREAIDAAADVLGLTESAREMFHVNRSYLDGCNLYAVKLAEVQS